MTIPLKVLVYKGSELVGEERFDREIIKIGRLSSAHLRLDDPKVSRIHAVIEVSSDGQGYSIIDMGSSDGTFVNGERVSKERLKHGDEVVVGECRLVISLEDDTAAAVAAVAAVPAVTTGEAMARDPNAWVATQTLAAASPVAVDPTIPVQPQALSPQPVQVAAAMVPMAAVPMAMQMPADGATMPIPVPQALPQVAWSPPPGQPMYATPAPGQMPSAYEQQQYAGYAATQPAQGPAPTPAWGSAPNNLASRDVPERERALEIKQVWGTTVVDTVSVQTKPVVTIGDEPIATGFGPFRRVVGCDLTAPTRGLPSRAYPLAVSQNPEGATYQINVHSVFTGHLEKPDGTWKPLEEVLKKSGSSEAGAKGYLLGAEETLYLHHDNVSYQVRYVRTTRCIPPPLAERLNYTWVNTLILVIFFHVLAVASFLSTPRTTELLDDQLFRNSKSFIQLKLIQEQKKKKSGGALGLLNSKDKDAAKAKGKEGKAGKKDMKETGKRMSVKAIKPDDKEIAKGMLTQLFGAVGNTRASAIVGTGGLGGELKNALGGVTGREIGDSGGLGGLGTRGSGPGGGGLSMNSVGLGTLGTGGRGGGGDGSYGSGAGNMGKKADRDIDITAGTPRIEGSLDKELIRRVIEAHKAQIRYCYEKELVRSPGLFGKINVQWVITADGGVRDAEVKDSTMQSDEVGRCICAKIRTWEFPKPKGGGTVLVKYPFVFKTTG
ncbi:MAG: AgmX/PglI C-terminal domain-containing protein [Deltaproteobacteria bacterium]|nr:AgmX/PglI C-terminal domain-containing protein [Deltaproteobacteria bacterium]